MTIVQIYPHVEFIYLHYLCFKNHILISKGGSKGSKGSKGGYLWSYIKNHILINTEPLGEFEVNEGFGIVAEHKYSI